MINNFKKLLLDIYQRKRPEFTGVGLVLYDNIAMLPVANLKMPNEAEGIPISNYQDLLDHLMQISESSDSRHDGFHLISTNNFVLTHTSQYFATQIVKDIEPEYRYGSRYRSAFYGSFIENVVACGVISNNYGPTIFVHGKKISL